MLGGVSTPMLASCKFHGHDKNMKSLHIGDELKAHTNNTKQDVLDGPLCIWYLYQKDENNN